MLTDDTELQCPTALVYVTIEEARLLLEADRELTDASRAAGEAAYHLSDTIEPDDRVDLLAFAHDSLRALDHGERIEARAAQALSLMSDAASEVKEILRGPNASSELRIGLRALRRGIGDLADRVGVDTSLRSEPLRLSSP
jgi:hypothetical protein